MILGPDWTPSSGPVFFSCNLLQSLPSNGRDALVGQRTPKQEAKSANNHRNTNEKLTKDGITKMKTFSSEELAILTGALQKSLDYVYQKETLTDQVSDLLDMLIPGDGQRLFTLGEWNRTPTLESEIIEWLTGAQGGAEDFRSRRVKTLIDGDHMVAVYAEHMIGDHWWVVVHNIRFHESEADFDEYRGRSPGRRPAAAIARIAGSSNPLKGC